VPEPIVKAWVTTDHRPLPVKWEEVSNKLTKLGAGIPAGPMTDSNLALALEHLARLQPAPTPIDDAALDRADDEFRAQCQRYWKAYKQIGDWRRDVDRVRDKPEHAVLKDVLPEFSEPPVEPQTMLHNLLAASLTTVETRSAFISLAGKPPPNAVRGRCG
jgi:hypothetical protein